MHCKLVYEYLNQVYSTYEWSMEKRSFEMGLFSNGMLKYLQNYELYEWDSWGINWKRYEESP